MTSLPLICILPEQIGLPYFVNCEPRIYIKSERCYEAVNFTIKEPTAFDSKGQSLHVKAQRSLNSKVQHFGYSMYHFIAMDDEHNIATCLTIVDVVVGHCMRPVIDFAVALSRPSCGMMSGSIITYSCLHQRSIFNVLLHLLRPLH